MKYTILNNSSFKFKTVDRAFKFVIRGFRHYVNDVLIEVENYWFDRKDEECVVDYSHEWRGCAWDSGLIRVSVSPDLEYPYLIESKYTPKTRYISGFLVFSRFELLLYLLAHEWFHICEFNLTKPIIVSNILPLDEESGADIFAMLVLNRWRRTQELKRRKDKLT